MLMSFLRGMLELFINKKRRVSVFYYKDRIIGNVKFYVLRDGAYNLTKRESHSNYKNFNNLSYFSKVQASNQLTMRMIKECGIIGIFSCVKNKPQFILSNKYSTCIDFLIAKNIKKMFNDNKYYNNKIISFEEIYRKTELSLNYKK